MNRLAKHTNGAHLSGYIPPPATMSIGVLLVLGVGGYLLYKAMKKR